MREIFIVGAGPAGSLAAILLARAGLTVTLFERSRFPRDKVCGECISALGWSVLERAGLAQKLVDAGAIALTHSSLHAAGGKAIRVDLPSPMHGLSRRAMDTLLLDAARDAGATIRQPARVERIDLQNRAARPTLTLRDLADNTLTTQTADLVLLADGKSTALTKQFGIKSHFTDIALPATGIDLFGFRGGYGGLAPIEAGRWNIAISVKQARLKEVSGDCEKLFNQFLGENESFAAAMKSAKRESDWLASPLPRAPVAKRWRENEIPIGNAAASLEPIGGEGMGLAMRSSELAAAAIARAAKSGAAINAAQLRADYRRLWNPRRAACRTAGAILSSPAAAALSLPLARIFPATARAMLRWIGK